MNTAKLLLSLVVIMLFTACVSSGKYKERLADIESLEQEVSALEVKLQTLEAEKAALEQEIPELETQIEQISLDKERVVNEKERAIQEKERAIKEKQRAIGQLRSTYDSLVNELSKEIKQGQIEITQLQDKLSLTMVEKILFDSGSADIKGEGKKVLDKVGSILIKVDDKQITIQGHTDNVPISSRLRETFPTNWELSTARATRVVRYLHEQAGLDPAMLIASGVGEYRPVSSNDTPEGRAKNRRIEIILLPAELKKAPVAEEQ